VSDAIGVEDHLAGESHNVLDVTAVRRPDLDAELAHDLRRDADAAFLFLMAVARMVIVAFFGVTVLAVVAVTFIAVLVGFRFVIVTRVIIVLISMTIGISAGGLLVVRVIVACMLIGSLGHDRDRPVGPQRQPTKQRQQNQ
jgi:hypothetical protein